MSHDQIVRVERSVKNGGSNGQGNGSCSGNSAQDIQYNLLESLEALFSW